MSYDIQVYTIIRPQFDTPAFRTADVSHGEAGLCFSKRDWQVVVNEPFHIEHEDMTDDVATSLPGLQYLTEIHIEPTSAPKTAYAFAHKAANTLAHDAHGVVVDQQAGTISTPRGLKRYTDGQDGESVADVVLGWWFVNADRFHTEGFPCLLQLMESRFPEMLPRRYGLFEPPQYRWEDHGKKHFVKLMTKNDYNLVWYAFKPVTYVFLHIPNLRVADRRGFRSANLRIHLSGAVLSQPGWRTHLLRFFRQAADILRPFYAEIRCGEVIPASWWWKGIPSIRGRCTLIGPPYEELWPAFVDMAERTTGELAYIDSFTPESRTPRGDIPPVPNEIAEPRNTIFEIEHDTGDVTSHQVCPAPDEYPAVFPFDRTEK